MSGLAASRRWWRQGAPAAGRLRLVDLNCLAPSLVDQVRYKRCDRASVAAPRRVAGIVQEILHHDADLVTLQEIEAQDFHCILTLLSNPCDANFTPIRRFLDPKTLGTSAYCGCHVPHDGTHRRDGTAILWRKDKFTLLSSQHVKPLPHSEWDQTLRTAVVVLKHESRPLIVASTHLVFNAARSEVKLFQIAATIQALHRLRLKYAATSSEAVTQVYSKGLPPVIWGGDFNFTPMSQLYTSILHRLPDVALPRVARSAGGNVRSIDQRLLTGQNTLFAYECLRVANRKVGGRSTDILADYLLLHPYMPNDYKSSTESKFLGYFVQDLQARPIRREHAYLGGELASAVHQHRACYDSASHQVVKQWMWATGQPAQIEDWSSSFTIDLGNQSVKKALCRIQQETVKQPALWLCPMNLKSACCVKAAGNELVEPAFTAFHDRQSGCIDYIWYTPNELRLVGICAPPAAATLNRVQRIPCPEYPVSDHLPLVVEFTWVESPGPVVHVRRKAGRTSGKDAAYLPQVYTELLDNEYHQWVSRLAGRLTKAPRT